MHYLSCNISPRLRVLNEICQPELKRLQNEHLTRFDPQLETLDQRRSNCCGTNLIFNRVLQSSGTMLHVVQVRKNFDQNRLNSHRSNYFFSLDFFLDKSNYDRACSCELLKNCDGEERHPFPLSSPLTHRRHPRAQTIDFPIAATKMGKNINAKQVHWKSFCLSSFMQHLYVFPKSIFRN